MISSWSCLYLCLSACLCVYACVCVCGKQRVHWGMDKVCACILFFSSASAVSLASDFPIPSFFFNQKCRNCSSGTRRTISTICQGSTTLKSTNCPQGRNSWTLSGILVRNAPFKELMPNRGKRRQPNMNRQGRKDLFFLPFVLSNRSSLSLCFS